MNKDFKFCESDDPLTEDDYYIYLNNKNITIQVCEYAYPYIYSVNKWNEKDESGLSIPCKSFKEAQKKAISL
mgnify:FL=1|tara:strand:- start:463 stop:678 length:216 start_codon:yes stop_codon:yes gene_type:complete